MPALPKGTPPVTRTPDHNHLAALLAIIQHNLRQEILQRLAGQPKAQAYDTDKTTGSHGSDPTATAATTPDRARHDLEAHDAAVDRAYRALLTLAALSDHYLPTHEPSRRTIVNDTKGCHLHERAGIEQHHPARITTDFASVLTEPLREPIPVCRACEDFVRRSTPARVPTTEELVRHNRTGKWSVRTSGKRATVFSAQDIADEWGGAA